MKISTINTVYWIAFAGFWSLLITDWVTPGKAPAPLNLIEELCLIALVAAYFYVSGTKRKTCAPDYEMSK